MKLSHNIAIKTYAIIALIVAVTLSGTARWSSAAISASVDASFIDYQLAYNDGRKFSANSLYHHYSIMYTKAAPIISSRLGRYNVSLGYEWGAFDTNYSFNQPGVAPLSQNFSGNSGKLSYRGEVLFDPREMPFKFRAYSMDMNRINLESGNTYSPFLTGVDPANQMNIPSDLGLISRIYSNGSSISSGATLVLGVKNGMTNGFNEIFRLFPMVMLDYRDDISKDSSRSIDTRLSRLAFVSLNKKDNWFHYRVINYNDYTKPVESYRETEIQLGNVDHTMSRQWVDFTNWLQVSADGQLKVRNRPHLPQTLSDGYQEFSLNLFGIASRNSWQAWNFNSFNRRRRDMDQAVLTSTSVPLYVSGALGTDTTWSVNAAYNESNQWLAGMSRESAPSRSANLGYGITTFSRSPFNLMHYAQTKQNLDSSDAEITSGIATTSTARWSRTQTLSAAYQFASTLNSTSRSFAHSLDIAYSLFASDKLNFNIRENVSANTSTTDTPSSYSAALFSGNPLNPLNSINPLTPSFIPAYSTNQAYFRSTTSLDANWNPTARLMTRFGVSESIYMPDKNPTEYTTSANASIAYDMNTLKIRNLNTYSIAERGTDYGRETLLSSQLNAQYTPNKTMDGNMDFAYANSTRNSSTWQSAVLQQRFNYHFDTVNGVIRRLAELSQTYTYSLTTTSNGSMGRSNQFSLGGRYYPLNGILLAGGVTYNFASNMSVYTIGYYGNVAFTYRKLSASLDYFYGTNTTDNRIEKKLTANVRKQF